MADQWNAFKLLQLVLLSGFNCAKKLPGLFLCNLQFLTCPKNNTLKKKSRVGLCDPPSGFLCLTFREMAKSLHEQSARATILNSNRPKPLADGGLDYQKVTTRESTQKTSVEDQNIKKLRGPLMADLKKTQVQSTIAQRVSCDLNEK
jgi:hypothetical protein